MEEALSLDMKVLEALLRRNRCSHGRTRYYKRISMATRALQRRFPLLQQALLELLQQRNACRKQEWTCQETKNFHAQVLIVQTLFDALLPEIPLRIQYAASALLFEIQRGFFLPFCTVALGALARIRILVMRIGRDQLSEFQSTVSEHNFVLEPVHWFENTMKLLDEDPTMTTPTNENDDQRVVLQLQSLGLVPKKSQRTNTEEVMNDKKKKIDIFARDETNFPPDKEAAIDDIGTSVTVRTTTARSTPTNPPSQQDESDRNFKLLSSIKVSKIDRKRTMNESETKKKKKKRKKEKKKDILDQIFGDM
jgi:hypothetical protein